MTWLQILQEFIDIVTMTHQFVPEFWQHTKHAKKLSESQLRAGWVFRVFQMNISNSCRDQGPCWHSRHADPLSAVATSFCVLTQGWSSLRVIYRLQPKEIDGAIKFSIAKIGCNLLDIWDLFRLYFLKNPRVSDLYLSSLDVNKYQACRNAQSRAANYNLVRLNILFLSVS